MSARVLIVSNRLPITISETDHSLAMSRSNGGLATALAATLDTQDTVWIGWAGLARDLSTAETTQLGVPKNLRPIGLSTEEIHTYYEGFANRILWPLAHGLDAAISFGRPLARNVDRVIEKFADAIIDEIQPDDIVWIHDYHLLYLPAELRRRGIKNRIGFFLHTPFWPITHQLNLPRPGQIANNIAACDVFGVQTQRDVTAAKKFMHFYPNLSARVRAFPIGVDFADFDDRSDDPTIAKLAASLKQSLSGRTIIFSLSRLDYTKGILTQLDAIERLAEQLEHPERIVYRLNVAPSRELVPEYADLKTAIEDRVTQINRHFKRPGWQPIEYSYQNIGIDEITAWYQISDIHLNTPIADGMNLIAKEYIAARRQPGVLVISQAMGAATQLRDALTVPPGDIPAITRALRQALTIPDDEKTARWNNLRNNVATHTVENWAATFIKAVKKSK